MFVYFNLRIRILVIYKCKIVIIVLKINLKYILLIFFYKFGSEYKIFGS